MHELCIKCDTRHDLQPWENGKYICGDCYMKCLKEKLFSKPLVNPLKKFKPKDDGSLKVCEEEKVMESNLKLAFQGEIWVKEKDYLKVVEENEKLKDSNIGLAMNVEVLQEEIENKNEKIEVFKKDLENTNIGFDVIIEELKDQIKDSNRGNERLSKENKKLKEANDYYMVNNKHSELEFMTNLCNDRGKKIKELEENITILKTKIDNNSKDAERFYYEVYKKEVNELREKIKALEKGLKYQKETDGRQIVIIHDLRKEIEEKEKRIQVEIKNRDWEKNKANKLDKEIKEMKTLKVCMGCQKDCKETIDKYLSKGRYLFIDNCLKEDCELCGSEEKRENRTMKPCEKCNSPYSTELNGKYCRNCKGDFVDSWMLSYKVEGMNEPFIQHHLTKEECEIIYGNMDNITYWFMELMK